MNFRVTKSLVLALAAAACFVSAGAFAQDKPAMKPPAEPSPSRWDIFAGYSYLAPHDTVYVQQSTTVTGVTATLPFSYKSVNIGNRQRGLLLQ